MKRITTTLAILVTALGLSMTTAQAAPVKKTAKKPAKTNVYKKNHMKKSTKAKHKKPVMHKKATMETEKNFDIPADLKISESNSIKK